MRTGHHLILETKGKDSEENRSKRKFLAEWVTAVNEDGRFGVWNSDVSFDPGDIHDILAKYS
jgi:type III restriction enzyme